MACQPQSSSSTPSQQVGALRYARLLSIEHQDSLTLVSIKSPWRDGGVLQRYVLVPKSAPLPRNIPHGTLVRTPLQRTVMHNSVHAYLAMLLGQSGRVAGICDVDYIVNEELRRLVEDSLIYDAGSSVKFNIERNIKEGADAVFASPLEDVSHAAMSIMGVPIIECADYMEPHPLGRAEWMKFFGLLLDCPEVADSLFSAVETAYLALRSEAQSHTQKPRLMVDLEQAGTWYMPGGKSYLATLFKDAGAHYVLAENAGMGSVAVGSERAIMMGRNADVWLIKYAQKSQLSYKSLEQNNAIYATFKAWKNRQIYGCNTLHTDFYERMPFQPHLLLKELSALLHKQPHTPAPNDVFQPLSE